MKPWQYIAVGCILASLLVCAFIIGRATAPAVIMPGEKTVDTVTKVVTMWKDFPQPVKTASAGFVAIPSYKFFTDTLTREVVIIAPDTSAIVYVPREQRYYEEAEGTLRLWVSGVDPTLDRWELDQSSTTITERYKPRPKRWGLGLSGGYGLTLVDGKIRTGPTVSVTISFNFLTW